MYAQHFEFRCLPFEDAKDAHFFFSTPDREEALAAMQCQTQHGSGMSLTLGEAGTGKTTLIREFLRKLSPTTRSVLITCVPGSETDLLRLACDGCGLTPPPSAMRPELVSRLRRHLRRNAENGCDAVVVIDQAEHLSEAGLADLTMLAELRGTADRVLTILLCAQPRFVSAVAKPEFARLRQELYGEKTILAFSAANTPEYVRHRLRAAGSVNADVFEPGALELIHQHSRGLPRLINKLCDAALIAAYGAEARTVSAAIVEEMTRGDAPKRKSMDIRELGLSDHGAVIAGLGRRGSVATAINVSCHDPEVAAMSAISPARVEQADGAKAADARLEGVLRAAERVQQELAAALRDVQSACGRPVSSLGLSGDADRKLAALETKIERASAATADIERQVQRAASACEKAEDIGSRLSSFADQLADRADELQGRINLLLGNVESAAAVECRLREVIDRSDAACHQTASRMAAMTKDAQVTIENQAGHLARRVEQVIDAAKSQVNEAVAAAETSIQSAVCQVESVAAEQAKLASELIADSQARLVAVQEQFQTTRDEVVTLGEKQHGLAAALASSLDTADRIEAKIGAFRVEIAGLDEKTRRISEAALALDAPLSHKVKQTDELLGKTNEVCQQAAGLQAQVTAALVEVGAGCERVAVARQQAKECRETAEHFTFAAEHARKIGEQTMAHVAAAERAKSIIEQALTKAEGCSDNLELRAQVANEAGERLTIASGDLRALLGQADSAAAAANRAAGSATQSADAATAQIAEAADRVKSIQTSAEKTGRCLSEQATAAAKVQQALAMLMHGADEKLTQLASHQAAAGNVLEHLTDCTKDAHRGVQQIESERRAMEESAASALQRADQAKEDLSSVLDQSSQQGQRLLAQHAGVAEAALRLDSLLTTATEAASGLQDRIAQSIEASGGLQIGCERAEKSRQQVERDLSALTAASESLEAASRRAASERNQLDGSTEQAGAIQGHLGELLNNARELVRSWEKTTQEAETTLEGVTHQVASLHESQAAMAEQESRIKAVQEQIASLEIQTAHLGHVLSHTAEEPKRVLESAQAQTAELERVLAAVRKVFTGLSKASLEAKRQADFLDAKGRNASQRLSQLAATNQQASRTLSQWISEAIRVQGRLEATLVSAPSIEETHPADRLHDLAQVAVGAANEPVMIDPQYADPASHSPRVTAPRTVATRSVPVHPGVSTERAEQIASILEEARSAPGN